jgi:threonine 3-dehydrogenase
MTTTMKALVKSAPRPGLTLDIIPIPKCGADEVLIKVISAAICGTDIHIYNWDEWASSAVKVGTVIGHEFVGTVSEVGSSVTEPLLGTRVAGEGHVTCGTCRNCRSGDRHICRNTIGVGIDRDGGFAEYVAIPASNAYRVPETLPDDVAAILDPLGNAVHTALSFDVVGEDVLITGAGPIGLMALAVCRHAGARHVVITDTAPQRLERATRMGASAALVSKPGALKGVMEDLGIVEGFDIALEMSGNPRALADIFEWINHGGKVALLGLYDGPAKVDLNQTIFKGLTLKGIYGREMFDTWYKALSMLGSGLDIDDVISHRLPLEDYQEAFDLVDSGRASKVVLNIAH